MNNSVCMKYTNDSAWVTMTNLIRMYFRFGGKEDYMTFMNDFVENELPNAKMFITQISVSWQSEQ